MVNAKITPLEKDEYFVKLYKETEDPESPEILFKGHLSTPELRNLQEVIDNAIYP